MKDGYGHSALRYAREESHEAIVKLLLEHGADPNDIVINDNINGYYTIMI